MQRSIDRFLTTHTGSLPRPQELRGPLHRYSLGTLDESEVEALATGVSDAIEAVVARQVAVGVDVVGDGEMSKDAYSTYFAQRLSGFSDGGLPVIAADLEDFPGVVAASTAIRDIDELVVIPACTGDVAYVDTSAVDADIANLSAAATAAHPAGVFMTAASPGLIATVAEDRHYGDHESYLAALVDAMRVEYEAIHAAGFVLQLDCPDLAMGRHMRYRHLSLDEWRRIATLNVEAINAATSAIPEDAMRMHVCWGNYNGPHTHDVPMADVIDVVLRARPAAIAFEAANPRHEHEWKLFEDVALPDGKLLIPGVIDSTTNYVEHPELVAERILRFAKLVGAENVIAGVDCGFSSGASYLTVDEDVAWVKLAALAQGAALASTRR
jgi:5-methyltetrahydropteroyltriglutamate--homocysteine methyltransferase